MILTEVTDWQATAGARGRKSLPSPTPSYSSLRLNSSFHVILLFKFNRLYFSGLNCCSVFDSVDIQLNFYLWVMASLLWTSVNCTLIIECYFKCSSMHWVNSQLLYKFRIVNSIFCVRICLWKWGSGLITVCAKLNFRFTEIKGKLL